MRRGGTDNPNQGLKSLGLLNLTCNNTLDDEEQQVDIQ
jgi:hypothetical protein